MLINMKLCTVLEMMIIEYTETILINSVLKDITKIILNQELTRIISMKRFQNNLVK